MENKHPRLSMYIAGLNPAECLASAGLQGLSGQIPGWISNVQLLQTCEKFTQESARQTSDFEFPTAVMPWGSKSTLPNAKTSQGSLSCLRVNWTSANKWLPRHQVYLHRICVQWRALGAWSNRPLTHQDWNINWKLMNKLMKKATQRSIPFFWYQEEIWKVSALLSQGRRGSSDRLYFLRL